MSVCRDRVLALLIGAALTACAPFAPPTAPSGSTAISPGVASAVAVREHLTGRFIALIGPKAQHAPPYLGTSGTNFYCLRSFIDRNTGETADQLYISDSYDGIERNWDGAHDGAGRALVFVPISRDKIACDGGCSYTEEFAADIPEDELRASPQRLAVTFTDHAGDEKSITVSAEQIAAQLAALDAQRNAAPSAAASAAPAHQP
jgi:hypothetical protein